jgi:hypothetical protein
VLEAGLLHPEQVGRQQQDRVCTRPLGGFRELNRNGRAVARATDDPYPPSRLLDRGAHDALQLRHRQRKAFAAALYVLVD